jgi:hypothetical protein
VSIWTNSDGKILKSETGAIFTCDDCPCEEGCSSYASSYFITHTINSWHATVLSTAYPAILAVQPACMAAYLNARSTYCYWVGATVEFPTVRFVLLVNATTDPHSDISVFWNTSFCPPTDQEFATDVFGPWVKWTVV